MNNWILAIVMIAIGSTTAQAIEVNKRKGLNPSDRLLVNKALARAHQQQSIDQGNSAITQQVTQTGGQNVGVVNQGRFSNHVGNIKVVVASTKPIININNGNRR